MTTQTAPQTVIMLRCCCGKLLIEMVTPPYRITCRHCKVVHEKLT